MHDEVQAQNGEDAYNKGLKLSERLKILLTGVTKLWKKDLKYCVKKSLKRTEREMTLSGTFAELREKRYCLE